MKKILTIGLAACTLAACKPNLNTQKPTAGTADFSRYVSVGNSLTAGYANGSLYKSGQENSYPKRLSEQFALVGGGDFKQPLMPDDVGYPSPKLVLGATTSCLGITSLSPVPYNAVPDSAASYASIAAGGPYNNVGVPGIRCIDYLAAGYAYIAAVFGGVPYASRFYPDPENETPLNEALRINATFFTCWLGNNDVLGYATAGGQGDIGGNPPLIPTYNISPTGMFQTVYDSVINALTRNGAKGVLIGIPDVTSIPFFTTIPANGLTLRQGQADSLNAAWSGLGPGLAHFTAGANYFMIQDHDGHVRQATSADYILLITPQDSLTCAGWGSLKPIPNSYVLDEVEVGNVRTATNTFNTIISNAAQAHNLAYVDMLTYLQTVSSGIKFNGVSYNAQFVSGGAFSLDGIHLTPRGYAIVANHILEAINNHYKSTLPMIDVNKYDGLRFP